MTFLEPTGLTVSFEFLLKATNAVKTEKTLQLKNLFSKEGAFKNSCISYIINYFQFQVIFGVSDYPVGKIVSE